MKNALRSALLVILTLTLSPSAHGLIVERVVAVVGERPILFSELQHRARPFLSRILSASRDPARQAASQTEMYRELLDRMIDGRLEEQAAERAHIGVSPSEVDQALAQIAGRASLTREELLREAERQGLSEQDYRDELRRQLLEGKLVELRVRGRVRVTEEDVRRAYSEWQKEQAGARSDVPAYEDVRDAMVERALGEALEVGRRQWLRELRRGVFVDVRL